MENDLIYEQAELKAEQALCEKGCLCPVWKEQGFCSDCDVFLALREYYIWTERDKEVENVSRNNERLTKQLENSVQLPCKVGDTVYYIREAISKNPYEPKIEVGTVLKIIVTKSGLRLALSMNSVYENSTNSIGKSIFFDEQEANNALENLKQRMK